MLTIAAPPRRHHPPCTGALVGLVDGVASIRCVSLVTAVRIRSCCRDSTGRNSKALSQRSRAFARSPAARASSALAAICFSLSA